MARPTKDPSVVLSSKVEARISAAEHAALKRLIEQRDRALAAEGITNQDTFAGWLRWMIRREAAAAGFAVPAAEPVPSTPPAKRAARRVAPTTKKGDASKRPRSR